MGGFPAVLSTNGYGTPVKVVSANAPSMTLVANGFGIPIVFSDNGAPFIVDAVGPYEAPLGYRWGLVTENSVPVTENGQPVIELERIAA
jgi:hypothetical protein